MKIKIYNIKFNFKKIKTHEPVFISYKEDIKFLEKKLKKFQKFKNLIIIGNGGSVNNFKAIYGCLKNFKKNVEILNTIDIDRITEIKKKYKKKNTLVIAVSKSGQTINVIEEIFAFYNYKKIFVTGGGTMSEIGEIEKINHPSVSGRFSGFTSSCYVPSILCGFDVNKIENSARKFYKYKKHFAMKLSCALYELEKIGYTEIMCSIYSYKFVNFLPIIIQLMHETICKEKKGQTIYGDQGPEIQHHTNQRFFGGRDNVIGLFVTIKNKKADKIKIPKNYQNLKIKNLYLKNLDNVSYESSMKTEFLSVKKILMKKKKPFIEINLDNVSYESVGEFLVFWYLVSFYSAILRKVNPYNQPGVEESKKINFKLRKKLK